MIKRHNKWMQAGLNSDIQVQGRDFHIQTEDWGWKNPFIVTKIFSQGQVLRSIKSPYKEVVGTTLFDDSSIRRALKDQHHKILDRLVSGQL